MTFVIRLYSPRKSRKHSRGLGCVANVAVAQSVSEPDSHGDESREPEEHGKRLGGQNAEFVRRGREEHGRETEVDECEKRPDGGEDQESDLGWRVMMPVAGPPVGDWICQ